VTWNTPVYQSNGASTPTLLDSDVRARRFVAPVAQAAATFSSAVAGTSSSADRFEAALLLMVEEESVGSKKRK
jgi:hypothetical protein